MLSYGIAAMRMYVSERKAHVGLLQLPAGFVLSIHAQSEADLKQSVSYRST